MIRGGRLFKRYELKLGKKPPAEFEPACDLDPVTGKQQGWLAVGERLVRARSMQAARYLRPRARLSRDCDIGGNEFCRLVETEQQAARRCANPEADAQLRGATTSGLIRLNA